MWIHVDVVRLLVAIDARGPIAQGLEQATHNRLVGGSNPSGPTILTQTGKPCLANSWPIFRFSVGQIANDTRPLEGVARQPNSREMDRLTPVWVVVR